METAVCVLIKSNETNLRSIMRPLEWYGNASCRPRSVKLRIATRYPFSTNVTGFQPPVRTSVSYSRYFIERPIEKDFQRVTLRFLWRDNRRLSINKRNVTGNEIYILFYFFFFLSLEYIFVRIRLSCLCVERVRLKINFYTRIITLSIFWRRRKRRKLCKKFVLL